MSQAPDQHRGPDLPLAVIDRFGTDTTLWGEPHTVERIELWAFVDTGQPALRQRRCSVQGSEGAAVLRGRADSVSPQISRPVEIRQFTRAHYAHNGRLGGLKRRIKTVPA